MTRLAELPDEATILGFRGELDFAIWRGIPYARRWPNKAAPGPLTGSWATAAALGDYSTRLKALATPIVDAAIAASQGSNQTWRDLVISSGYGSATHT